MQVKPLPKSSIKVYDQYTLPYPYRHHYSLLSIPPTPYGPPVAVNR